MKRWMMRFARGAKCGVPDGSSEAGASPAACNALARPSMPKPPPNRPRASRREMENKEFMVAEASVDKEHFVAREESLREFRPDFLVILPAFEKFGRDPQFPRGGRSLV